MLRTFLCTAISYIYGEKRFIRRMAHALNLITVHLFMFRTPACDINDLKMCKKE